MNRVFTDILSLSDFEKVLRDLPPLIHSHLSWLREESTRHNLTRVPEEDWIVRHVLDSLAPSLGGWSFGESFLDMGTGPGFPGVPLAILAGEVRFNLLESKKKTAALLTEFLVRHSLDGRGAALGERVEDLGRSADHRGRYDRVVTRALAPLPVLIEYGLPFLRVNGELWCWKSDVSEINESSAALAEMSADVARLLEYKLPGEERSRVVIAIRKEGPTPEKYPRKSGVPRKRPIS